MVERRSTLSLKMHLLTGCHVINKVSTKESAIKEKDFYENLVKQCYMWIHLNEAGST